MKNLLFSLFAIGVAAVAAMTATTALINTPVRTVPAAVSQNLQAEQPPAAPASGKPADAPGGAAGGPGAASTPGATPEAGKSTPGAAPNADTKAAEDEEVDKDPYEGIAPEELPPDLQYSADSSVSFPTNI